MKKLYITLVTFLFLAVANAQIVNIPNASFKLKLLSASTGNQVASTQTPYMNISGDWVVNSYNKIDINNDGEIQVSEALAIKYLDVSLNSNLSFSLVGISNFSNLQALYCSYSHLQSLDVSGLTNLITLNCSHNNLLSLDAIGLPNLLYLDCSYNQLPSLDISDFPNLQTLRCFVNQLTSLNVTSLTNLQVFHCNRNLLTTLNVSGLTNLQNLSCYENQLTSLNVSGLTNLQYLDCITNQLTTLNVNGLTSLQTLLCDNNQLPSLNVSGLTNLQYLYCSNNQLPSLDVSSLPNLNNLDCSNNQLTSLFIKNGNTTSWIVLAIGQNPNLAYICTDEEDVPLVQTRITEYGYTNCTVDSNCNLSIETNTYDDNYFTIYPNPVNEVLNLTTKQATEINSLTIYNLLGQQVQTTTNPTNTIDVSSLKTGNYIIKVVTDKGVSSSKFVKE